MSEVSSQQTSVAHTPSSSQPATNVEPTKTVSIRPAHGRGKGLGKGKGKLMDTKAVRHLKVANKPPIDGITKPSLRRLARRGGVKRISSNCYGQIKTLILIQLEKMVKDALTYSEHAHRKTITVLDVVYALKRNGRQIYGFGG